MAFRLVSGVGVVVDPAGFTFQKGTATAFAVGDILAIDVSANELIRATSSHDNNAGDHLFALCVSTETATSTTCLAIPLVDGMVLEADLANNSTTADNLERMTLTDQDTLNNSGSDSAADTGVFLQLAPVGAAADKKALVMVKGIAGQVTA